MPVLTFNNQEFEVDENGHLANHKDWSRELM